jgi:arylsulfatase A-like enzyme
MKLLRRDFIKKAAALSALGTMAGSHCVSTKKNIEQKQPNLVIVFPDQMRGQALGFLNEDPVVTPNLDRFAKQSLVLPQAVSNYPVCSPYRAMLMTGKYPHSNGVTSNCYSVTAPFGNELKQTERCWSDVLKDKGYSLGYIGKWHLDAPHEPYVDCNNNKGKWKWNEWCPPERRHGFDYWYSYGTYDYHMNPMYWRTDAKRNEFHFVDQWGPEHEADTAIDYIHNKNGACRTPNQPFALVVSMNPPHTSYDQFPKKYLQAYKEKSPLDLLVRPNVDKGGKTKMSQLALGQTKNYFANITGVDAQFGRIVQAIDDAGLKEDTIILFTSDHGNCVGTHNYVTKNNPFEESMRVPFIIRWPGKIKPRHDDLLISVPDMYPTLLDLMGYKDAIPSSVQGKSYAELFSTGKGRRPSSQLYLQIPYNPETSYSKPQRGVRTHHYKLLMTAIPNKPLKTQLFDLERDPYEMKDIAASNVDIVKQLIKEELYPWLEHTKDPWISNLKKFNTADAGGGS